MVAQVAQSVGSSSMALSRHHLLRYTAALCGLVSLVLFYQPWVDASLHAVGDTSLTGIELARGDALRRVNQAVFGGTTSTAGAGSATIAGAGGIVLPTRIPTVAAGGSGGFGTSSGAAAGQPTAVTGSTGGQTTAPVAAPGGVVIPTRIPTVVPGSGSGFGTTGGAVSQPTAAAASSAPQAAAAATPPPAPPVLPKFWLHIIPLAALGLMVIPVVWDRFTEQRDRGYGRTWSLMLSYGGMFFVGYVLWRIGTAPSTNALLGSGVGSVRSALPGLWGTFAGFAIAAVCLTIAWLSPTPPAPDPYWRAKAST